MAQFSVQLALSQLAQTINPWSWTFGPIGQVGPKVQDQGLMVWAS